MKLKDMTIAQLSRAMSIARACHPNVLHPARKLISDEISRRIQEMARARRLKGWEK